MDIRENEEEKDRERERVGKEKTEREREPERKRKKWKMINEQEEEKDPERGRKSVFQWFFPTSNFCSFSPSLSLHSLFLLFLLFGKSEVHFRKDDQKSV